jgi:hypothetical protein
MNNADDHMRLIKAVLKNALAGVNAAMTRIVGSTFALGMPDGTSTDPAYSFASETTLGIRREAAGVMRVTGGVLKGVLPVGSIHMFVSEPDNLGAGGTGTGHDYLELDGATWPNASFPDLADHLGQGGTTFTLKDMYSLGRFPRSRSGFQVKGATLTSSNIAHTHGVSGSTGNESANHTHSFSGTTSSMNANASHTHALSGAVNQNAGNFNNAGGGGGSFSATSSTNVTINSTNTDHQHTYSGDTGGMSVSHHHDISLTSASSGGSETRPECIAFIFCIKT